MQTWTPEDDTLLNDAYRAFAASAKPASVVVANESALLDEPSGYFFERYDEDSGVSTEGVDLVMDRHDQMQRLLIGASIACGLLAILAVGSWAAWWRKR